MTCLRIDGGRTRLSRLREVLGRLPTHPRDRLAELLPDCWQRHQAAAPEA